MVKRNILVLSAIMCIIMLAMSINAGYVITDNPSRVINVVYDDSGSMIYTDDKLVDTWCQAKYAMEVFSSMLGVEDTMNIYVMSDFYDTSSAPPMLTLKGSDGVGVNVSKVHNMITPATNTPFDSVRQAYSDLVSVSADEKWLVVLTDGEFQGVSDIDAFFAQKDDSVRVMFLSMGSIAAEIRENRSKNIYFEKAQSSTQILDKITGICTRIFNSDRLDVDYLSRSFNFDVPMGELIVFAQGANVSINGIKTPTGDIIKSISDPVEVKYSEKAATNYKSVLVAKDLVGNIATFRGDFSPGKYVVDVSGAETIEIYYKPNVTVAVYLTDKNGNEISESTAMEAGDYRINFGFVEVGTGEKIKQSQLLGEVTYKATVINNGEKHEKTYAPGDVITVKDGSLYISATAYYLEYNSVSTSLEYQVFRNKEIKFSIVDNPIYTVTTEGFSTDLPIRIKATIDGQDFSEEQWNAMELPTVNTEETTEYTLGDFKIEKSDEVGIFTVKPTLRDGIPSRKIYADGSYVISYDGRFNNEQWHGNDELPLKFKDERSWWERNKDTAIKVLKWLAIAFLVIGYLPGPKAYLPKDLKKRPNIAREPLARGLTPGFGKGKLKRKVCTTIIPYCKQTGEIKFVPAGVVGVSPLKVRAVRWKHEKMDITNIKDYAGNPNVTFNGSAIQKECSAKSFRIYAGTPIRFKTQKWSYTCQPNT